MESWSNGREQLFQKLIEVCDQIGSNIQAEVNNDKFIRVDKEELHELRKFRDEHAPIVERFGNLEDELSRYKATAARVDGLEKENKRLAAELQQQLQTRQEPAATPKPLLLLGETAKLTPGPNDSPSSASRIDDNEKQSVPLEKYQSQVLKYNKLYEQHQNTESARKTLKDLLRIEKEKGKDWNVSIEEWEKIIADKTGRIRRLNAEIRRLKALLPGETPGLEASTPADHGPASSLLPQLAKESFHEHFEVEVPISSPTRNPPTRVTDDDTLLYYGRASGARAETDVEERENDPELPRHSFRPVEETQFVALEAPHTSSTEGDTDPVSPLRATNQDTPELLARKSPPETPVVVGTRSLKKRKNTYETEGTPVSRVKVETITSSPIGLATFFPLHDSLDLDDIGEKVDTPRKQHRFQPESSRRLTQGFSTPGLSSHIGGNQGHGHTELSYDRNPSITSKNPPARADSVLQPRSTNRQILPKTSEKRPSKKRRVASDKDVDILLEDGELAGTTPVRGRRQDSDRLNDLLSKPSPPKQALSPVHRLAAQQQSHRSVATSGLAHEVRRMSPEPKDNHSRAPHITEDVVPKGPSRDARDNHSRSTTLSRPSSKGSVAGQFESSRSSSRDTSRTSIEPDIKTEPGTSAVPLPQASNAPMQPSQPTGVPLPPSRDLQALFTPKPHLRAQEPVSIPKSKLGSITRPKFGMDSAFKMKQGQMGASTTSATRLRRTNPNNMTREDYEMDPDQEPLRCRPVERLRLSDFKANLSYNQGYQHPYRETIRGGDRQHLAGCQKECCRPKFRALAKITTSENPTPSQEDRDEELLINHMGDNAYKLQSMTREQRYELLLQAKTRDFSNAMGRHRAAYTRPTSPPGFWRAGFPTTQEVREDQEEAKRREKEEIVQRYDEAMRPGGRFLFRDE
ncbi:uncharacterized protein PAC_18532 [Phialocephala subalpina]|uniref:DNA endonuclease activator Ctp1 C-terminal domain-containing protein n=1 Tax=Phialocephala subalpina TaxID=576137 RepID=A0A1L7XUE1_9HELO|nr:uncharacterized protein PAC_18532 [Phialocephala subalpina]